MFSCSEPFFTVVMATYGRGPHIKPSIRSVLQQDYRNFELIVVGDHCDDDTEAVVAEYAAARWINLEARCGSQSAPNNAGIEAAHGDVIAYIGHDDIWEQDHLTNLAEGFVRDSGVDFVVSGAIFHLPNGISGSQVTGLFDDDSAKHIHFFPPSSFAHRKSVCEKIGRWNMPMEIRAAVDADFLKRAAGADLRFASTGKITVHKFAAGHRYLSYLEHSSDEQEEMLQDLKHSEHAARIHAIVERSREYGTFMTIRHIDCESFAPGQLARQNAMRKGNIQKPEKLPSIGIKIHQIYGNFALDWQDRPQGGIRWTRRNPMPKFLLPYTHSSPVELYLTAFHEERDALDRIILECNGDHMEATGYGHRKRKRYWSAKFRLTLNPHPSNMSILHFRLLPNQIPKRDKRGLGIGPLIILTDIPRLWLRPDILIRRIWMVLSMKKNPRA